MRAEACCEYLTDELSTVNYVPHTIGFFLPHKNPPCTLGLHSRRRWGLGRRLRRRTSRERQVRANRPLGTPRASRDPLPHPPPCLQSHRITRHSPLEIPLCCCTHTHTSLEKDPPTNTRARMAIEWCPWREIWARMRLFDTRGESLTLIAATALLIACANFQGCGVISRSVFEISSRPHRPSI